MSLSRSHIKTRYAGVLAAGILILTGLALSALPTFTYAQETTPLINSTLTGTVVDAETGEPLSGATLQLQGITHVTKSDNLGQFRFVTGQKFPYTVIVSYVGYVTQEVVAT